MPESAFRRCHRRLYVDAMHFFLYEWCTGGGLVNEPGSLPISLVREGVTMAGSLAADLARIPGAKVTALRDPRVVQLDLHGGDIIDVQSCAEHLEEFERLASDCRRDDPHRAGIRRHPVQSGAARGRVRRTPGVAVAGLCPPHRR